MAEEETTHMEVQVAAFQIYTDSQGEYRWRLRADNNQVIATSGEGYKDKADCRAGVDLVRSLAPEADLEEEE